MKSLLLTAFLTFLVTSLGCDVDVHEPGAIPATTPASPSVDSQGVQVDVNDTPLENRLERREARRENLGDTIDGVDVEVGDGGVRVDVDEE